MWTLIKREINDNAVIWVLGIAVLLGMIMIPLIGAIRAYDVGSTDRLGLSQQFEGGFNICILFISLWSAALGANQLNKDRTKNISAFLVTLATTRERVFLAKVLMGIIFIFVGVLISTFPVIIMLKMRPPLLPVDYLFLKMRLITALCFVVTAYMAGLAFGLSLSQFTLVIKPLFLLVLLTAMIFIRFFSPIPIQEIWILMAAAFFIYTRQQFLRASL